MNPIIKLRNVKKSFQTKTGILDALSDINLNIMEGEIYGIIGMSGAGKSTLVRCINLLEKPTEGEVFFGNKNLMKLKTEELNKIRHSMGMIFQQFNLLMQRTALQNICFPLEIIGTPKKEAEERGKELLEIVGLSDKASAYPAQLSGGQKQRVAIARALATKPKVLLCDEATSALDPTTTRSILSLLKDINKNFGITIIIITHEMSVIEAICQKVAILDDGKVVESGFVDKIFTRPSSSAAKKLVFPDGDDIKKAIGSRCCRIVFDGHSSYEPIIANMILKCKTPVNIMFADTRNIDGKAFGQIVIQLPEDKLVAAKIIHYLTSCGLVVEEIEKYG